MALIMSFLKKIHGSNAFVYIYRFFEVMIKNRNPIAVKNYLKIEMFFVKSSLFKIVDTFPAHFLS